MRTSSTRRRMGAALAVTTLGLFSLGGSAFAGESNGKGAEKRNDRAGSAKADTTEDQERPAVTGSDDDDSTPDVVTDGSDNMHPSGNDRHEDKGAQGRSTSDPDSDGIGRDNDSDGPDNDGPDKPFLSQDGTGGVDQQDQDGNNGCGNDDDFEDDNNGNCGGKRRVKPTPPETPEKPVTPELPGTPVTPILGTGTVNTVSPGAVLGTQLQNVPAGDAVEARVLGVTVERAATGVAAAPAAETAVLGASFTRGSVLARTGFGLTVVGLLGLALVLVGAGLAKAGRREHGPLA